ncbi:MAG: glycosyltransferase family 2 protein [Candidatus Caenarcaniphilales bacterium]|nr:glycosyltransferase family 2 protein [Candidatus Caenarcaniphilales bacterium]
MNNDLRKQLNSEPLIAIAMATYNPSKEFLIKQLESLKNQTYKNWFCVIVDDCSQPESFEEIQKLIQNDNRFKLYQNEKNLGAYLTFEQGLLKIPEGTQFITFCDQDDVWLPNKLEILSKKLIDNPKAYLVHSDLETINENDKTIQKSCWDFEKRSVDKIRTEFLILRNLVTGCSMMFRKEILNQALPFPSIEEPNNKFILHDLWITLCCSVLGPIEFFREPLVLYRQHSNNVVGSAGRQSPFIKILKAITNSGGFKTVNWILGTGLSMLESRELLIKFLKERMPDFKEISIGKSLLKAFLNGYHLHTVPILLFVGFLVDDLCSSAVKERLRREFKL